MRIKLHRSIVIYLLLSFLIHFGLFLFPTLLKVDQPTQIERIEMSVVDSPPEVSVEKELAKVKPQKDELRKIVDQAEKPMNDEIDNAAKFLSAHNQKVIKQTIARQRGEFKNVAKENPLGQASQAEEPVTLEKFIPKMDIAKTMKDRQEMEQKFDEDADFRMRKQSEAKSKPSSAEKAPSVNPGSDTSATLDYIKEIDPGLETVLSTKEFRYYTYFSRIRQQLNQHWTPRVRQKVALIYKSGRSIASSQDMITRCLVTLDQKGQVVRVQIIGDSGIRELDEAAVEAFRAAAPFPNPPKGMIDQDGTIKIRWDFILEA